MSEVFNMINREMLSRHITKAELSRKLNVSQSTVQGMFRSKSIKVHRLIQISKILNYNFFSEIAHQLPVDNPVLELSLKLKEEEFSDEIESLNKEIERLKQKNETLKVKFSVLESVIDKLGGSKY